MRRTLIATIVCVAAAGAVQNAGAVFIDDTAHYMKHSYHANQQWPWPYQCPDRMAVREPFALMVNNGWRRQNLLGAMHFNPNTNQLSAAGQLRVQWIMTQAPPERRSIFVERTLDADVTAQRMATTREYAAKMVADGQPAQVAETSLMYEGRPAAVVDATNVNFLKAMPAPVLPAATTSSGSSTGQ